MTFKKGDLVLVKARISKTSHNMNGRICTIVSCTDAGNRISGYCYILLEEALPPGGVWPEELTLITDLSELEKLIYNI